MINRFYEQVADALLNQPENGICYQILDDI